MNGVVEGIMANAPASFKRTDAETAAFKNMVTRLLKTAYKVPAPMLSTGGGFFVDFNRGSCAKLIMRWVPLYEFPSDVLQQLGDRAKPGDTFLLNILLHSKGNIIDAVLVCLPVTCPFQEELADDKLMCFGKMKEKDIGNPSACASCDAVGVRTKVCEACKAMWYCSKQCQKNHWKTHKPVCEMFRAGASV